MMRYLITSLSVLLACLAGGSILLAAPQREPHPPDDHTLLLYHFDVGLDFWFSGKIDEVHISDCVRYDPENPLQVGHAAFEIPASPPRVRAVRNPQVTGKAQLNLTLRKLYGPNSVGFVSLKSPSKPAVIVGNLDLAGVSDQSETQLTWDVSDEMTGDGCFIVGLEETGSGGYFAVTEASLKTGDTVLATWSGQVASRRTFAPPLLIPLRVGAAPSDTPRRIVLLPEAIDRWSGKLDISREAANEPASLFGEGQVEYWLDVSARQTYRVYLRYAAPVARPCDLVIDGNDLHAFHMAARNGTGGSTPHQAFWEYQGTVCLTPGLHWIRLQDVLPEIVALRLEPVADTARPPIPWQRYPVPASDFLAQSSGSWSAEELFGQPRNAEVSVASGQDTCQLPFSVSFQNTDRQNLFGGDAVRMCSHGLWDLEPFGRLSFRFQGHASGHVLSLILVDLRGNEKLLWRHRDELAELQEFHVPVLFEGNDVFDPGHVVAFCLELDEGNTRVDQVNTFRGSLIDPVWERRDVIVPPEGYTTALSEAQQNLAATPPETSRPADRLVALRFQPWTSPVVPEEHSRFAQSDPKPVTRATLGYELHCTGARSIDPSTLDNYHKYVEPAGATSLLTNELGHPLITANCVDRGRVVVCTVDRWMTDPLQYRVPEIVHMTPPFQMLQGIRAVLADYFASFSPVTVEPSGLGVTTCCYADDPRRLLVGLLNNDLFADWQGSLQVRPGSVTSVKDILNERELPVPLQNPLPLTVSAGDAVILDVRW